MKRREREELTKRDTFALRRRRAHVRVKIEREELGVEELANKVFVGSRDSINKLVFESLHRQAV